MAIFSVVLHEYRPVLYCSGAETIKIADHVLVERCKILTLGKVVSVWQNCNHSLKEEDLPKILRVADTSELSRAAENARLAKDASEYCRRYIKTQQMDMKLVDVECLFDRSKLIFYFTAPTRVDFRELVRSLARRFRTRIELRQIGARQETQLVGSVGNCGMVCCCRRYLSNFAPVSIRMAKEQNLFLNPTKISGCCGRLLCCLAFEQDNYEDFYGKCPRLGKKYRTAQGTLKVLRANIFRNSISVQNDKDEEQEMSLDEWQALLPTR